MNVRKCSTGLLIVGGLSVGTVLSASPASAGTVTEKWDSGQRRLASEARPVCWVPGSAVPVSFNGTPYSAPAGNSPTTCYQLSYRYDVESTTWVPYLDSPCISTTDGPGAGLDQDPSKEWFDDKKDWFDDKRDSGDVIIGSITIGIGGPTVGGTGIVGGIGNTAGGTTAGFGGNTAGGPTVGGSGGNNTSGGTTVAGFGGIGAGGTTVGGFGNAVSNSGTTINAGGMAMAGATGGSGGALTLPACSDPAADYQRGWADGWNARDRARRDQVGVKPFGDSSTTTA